MVINLLPPITSYFILNSKTIFEFMTYFYYSVSKDYRVKFWDKIRTSDKVMTTDYHIN